MNGTPCPHSKSLKSGTQCPDCRLEAGRQKLRAKFNRQREERERLARIAKSTPPGATDEDDEGIDTELQDVDQDVETADAIEAASPPPRRRAGITVSRPGHRQPAPSGDTRGGSWWTQTTRETHSATAQQELTRMQESKEGKRMHRQLTDTEQ